MRRRLATAAVLVAVAGCGAAVADAELAQDGGVRISFGADFSPRELPRERPAPVTIRLDGSIRSTDGTAPPPVRRLVVELSRSGRLSTRGLPRCSAARLQSTSSARALELCRPARVGGGSFAAVVLENGNIPLSGRILVFLGGSQERPRLLLHLYASAPVRATFVLPMRIERRPRGRFGTVLRASIPRLAGGIGTVTDIRLRVGRSYRLGGERRSLLSASCAAPAGFGGALFSFARARFRFSPEREIGATLVRTCRVR